MSGITWEELSEVQQQGLLDVNNGLATRLVSTFRQLEHYGLVASRQGRYGGVEEYVTLKGKRMIEARNSAIDAGRALVPTASGNGGVGDARSLHQQTVTDAGIIDHLSSQIVHAQMLLQTALGYEEVDYHISLNDLETDILALRQQVASLRAALERIASGANMPAYCVEHGIEVSDNPAITMQRIAAKALGEADNGS